jgi:hypothetical protein
MRERERPVVPRASFVSSGEAKAIVKEPAWTPEIPFYFYAGGLAGASAGLAWLSELRGNHELARRAWAGALGGTLVSPVLLISDLGVPRRFLNMLRMFKVTSPMSVGSWVLSAFGAAVTLASTSVWFGWWGRAGRAARPAAAVLGLPLATYTGALVADTAIPAWHEARHELPFVFAGGAAASAGALATAATPVAFAAPARRLALIGATLELGAATVMERRLGDIGEPYHSGAAGKLGTAAKAATALGAGLIAARGSRSRGAAAGGAALVTAGAVLTRWSVYRAGFQSARRPQDIVGPQREAVARGERVAASRKVPKPVG